MQTDAGINQNTMAATGLFRQKTETSQLQMKAANVCCQQTMALKATAACKIDCTKLV